MTITAQRVRRCTMSDLPADQCWHCRPPVEEPPALGIVGRPEPLAEPRVTTSYEAQRPCRCGWCGRTIRTGEWMHRDEVQDENVCSGCAL